MHSILCLVNFHNKYALQLYYREARRKLHHLQIYWNHILINMTFEIMNILLYMSKVNLIATEMSKSYV